MRLNWNRPAICRRCFIDVIEKRLALIQMHLRKISIFKMMDLCWIGDFNSRYVPCHELEPNKLNWIPWKYCASKGVFANWMGFFWRTDTSKERVEWGKSELSQEYRCLEFHVEQICYPFFKQINSYEIIIMIQKASVRIR